MKTTQYLQHTRLRADRAIIREQWIKEVMDNPERWEIQSDGGSESGEFAAPEIL